MLQCSSTVAWLDAFCCFPCYSGCQEEDQADASGVQSCIPDPFSWRWQVRTTIYRPTRLQNTKLIHPYFLCSNNFRGYATSLKVSPNLRKATQPKVTDGSFLSLAVLCSYLISGRSPAPTPSFLHCSLRATWSRNHRQLRDFSRWIQIYED